MRAKDVLRLLNITRPTLTKYTKEGKIKINNQVNGQYDYNEESVFQLVNRNKTRKNVIYARVSTPKQKSDLNNQIEIIETFCLKNGIVIHDVYKDISSGMNLDRKDFLKMFEEVSRGSIDKIFITYKDRMARLSFQMIENVCKNFGTKIIILHELENSKTMEQEFLEEVSSLIHSFSMRMYSARRKEKLSLVAKDLDLEKNIKSF